MFENTIKPMTVKEVIAQLQKFGENTPVFAPDEGSGTLVPVTRFAVANGLVRYINETYGEYMRGVGIRTSIVISSNKRKPEELKEGDLAICVTPLEGYTTVGAPYLINKVLTEAGRFSITDDNGKECHARMDRFI